MAEVMGKSVKEVEELLSKNDAIELRLSERRKHENEDDELRIFE